MKLTRTLTGASAGIIAAAFGIAVAELLAAATRPQSGPLVAAGGAVIDATPTPVKEFAVRELGTNDKPVLLGTIVLVLALFTATVGALAIRRPVWAVAGATVFGAAGVAAALSRPAAEAADVLPALLGAAVAGGALLLLVRRANRPSRLADPAADPADPVADRAADPVADCAAGPADAPRAAVADPARATGPAAGLVRRFGRAGWLVSSILDLVPRRKQQIGQSRGTNSKIDAETAASGGVSAGAMAARDVAPRAEAARAVDARAVAPRAEAPHAEDACAEDECAEAACAEAACAEDARTEAARGRAARDRVAADAAARSRAALPPDLVMVDGRGSLDRRAFLTAASLVAGAAVVAGGSARLVQRSRGGAAARTREGIVLPAAADPAKPLPAGVGADFVTPNASFYRVDTALTVPNIDLSGWSLRVHGMVDREAELTFADLLARPLIERDVTLNCVSNEVGGPYVGTARWLGVPLAPLLRELGVRPGADQVVARSAEGMTIGTPTETVLDGRDTMLCVGMNGEPLPLEHGFPVRMLTPGLYGYAGACKWVTELELTTFAEFDAYWVRRGWAARGPVKTASRIDRPQPFASVPAGPVTVAGVAWAQGRGIESVEVRVDDGAWVRAELLPVPSVDTWVQWRHVWTAGAGPHTLTVRATDGTGTVQDERRVTPFPDGATGWHTTTVTVG